MEEIMVTVDWAIKGRCKLPSFSPQAQPQKSRDSIIPGLVLLFFTFISTSRGAASHSQPSPPHFGARGLFLELILVNKLAANRKTEGSENVKVARHHHNLQDRQGKTLLIYSCIKGQFNTVEELAADYNIDPNIPDNEGNTALIHASAAGHAKVVQLLVDRFPKIKIDQVNKLGQSALMKSAIQGRTTCAKILLRAGADPYKRDFGRQFCALEWAEYVGRTECAQTIAHFMLEPGHKVPDKKLSTASDNLKQVACLVAIPLIGGDMPVIARPRVRSAPPIPAVKITPSDGKFVLNNHKKAARSVSRPTSSLA